MLSTMAKITVLGATGFAGSWIASEAARRGHDVTRVARSLPARAAGNGRIVEGSVLDPEVLHEAIDGADVVVGAVSPRGDMVGKVVGVYADVAERLAVGKVRFIIVGGYGSLRAPDGGRVVDSASFDPAYRGESEELLAALRGAREVDGLDWTYVSPAAAFGPGSPDDSRRDPYRIGDDRATDGGTSTISGADFATAVVDEIENRKHLREHISLSY